MTNIIVGAVAIVLGLWGRLVWWSEFGVVLRGLVPFALLIVGLLFIASKFYGKKD